MLHPFTFKDFADESDANGKTSEQATGYLVLALVLVAFVVGVALSQYFFVAGKAAVGQ